MDLLSPSEFCKIHSPVVNLFPVKIKQLPCAGSVKHFVRNWQKLTNDPMILNIVRGYEIHFILPPRKSSLPKLCQLTKEATDLADPEVQCMLRKSAIVVSDPKEDQFLSLLFLVKKKDGGNHQVVNLKDLNSNIPYQHFKMEELFLLKEILQLVKSRKYARFQWKCLIYEFCCLCFGLFPASLVFTKLLKVPVSFLRKLSVRMIVYLDNIILMTSS